MTIANIAVEGIHKAQAAFEGAALRLANHPGVATDVVSLSDIALATIQARISISANSSVFRTAVEMEKALIDVMG
jgi:hypothetical protein